MNVTLPKTPANQDLEQLRSLLIGPEKSELELLQQKIQALESQLATIQDRAEFMAAALPESIDLSTGSDTRLHQALLPKVEHVVHTSVRRDPNIFAEALYPVMGPIIRKIVHKLFESGKRSEWSPFNVEQLFVIHRVSGLVISHESAPGIAYHDADMVSGMLDAVRSFVQEAFDSHEFDGLRLMTVGDVNVRIEWSPHVVLAAVVRGVEPDSLRPALEATLSDIHERYEEQLKDFTGDSSPFEAISPMLNSVISKTAPSRFSHLWMNYRPALIVGLALVVLSAIAWMIFSSGKWHRLLTDLSEEPGIVVVNHEHGIWSKELQLLQDPYASDITAVLEQNNYTAESIDVSIATFHSDDAPIRLQRASARLTPPEGVDLYLQGRVLYVVGNPPEAWLKETQQQVRFMDGINAIELASDVSPEWTTLP